MKKLLYSLSTALIVAAPWVLANPTQAGESDLEIHGFVSQGYIKSSNEANNYPVGNSGGAGSFNFNDFGINFVKQLDSNLRVGLQLFAQDRGGNLGNDAISLDWAYGDYHYIDALGFRAGKIKIPLGLYNASRDNDALRNPILLPQGIYTDFYRDLTNSLLGFGVYGTVPLHSAGRLSYEFYTGTVPITSDSALSKAMGANPSGSGPSYNYGLEWQTPVEGLRLMASGLWSKWTGTSAFIPGLPVTNWEMKPWITQVFSIEYVRDRLTLAAEYSPQDFSVNYDTSAVPPFIQKYPSDSWYVSGAYRFTDWFELGAYYNEYAVDKNHRDGSNHAEFGYPNPWDMYQNDLAVTLRFDPLRNVVVKLEAHSIEGVGLNWLHDPTNQVKDWQLYAAKVTYNF